MALTLKLLGIGQVTSTNGGTAQAIENYGSNPITKSALANSVILVNSSTNNALVDLQVKQANGTARYVLKSYDMAQNSRFVFSDEITLFLNSTPPDSVILVATSKVTDVHGTIDFVVNGLERDV